MTRRLQNPKVLPRSQLLATGRCPVPDKFSPRFHTLLFPSWHQVSQVSKRLQVLRSVRTYMPSGFDHPKQAPRCAVFFPNLLLCSPYEHQVFTRPTKTKFFITRMTWNVAAVPKKSLFSIYDVGPFNAGRTDGLTHRSTDACVTFRRFCNCTDYTSVTSNDQLYEMYTKALAASLKVRFISPALV